MSEGAAHEIGHLSQEERDRIARLPIEADTHDRLLDELPLLSQVEVGRPPRSQGPPRGDTLRVVGWNAERGRFPEGAAAMLAATRADVFLLSELDVGMARTDQRHTARDLAERLGCGYAYAVEFVELGLGDVRERTALAGQANERGLHGGAILAPTPLARPRVERIERTGQWFDGSLGERRVGTRIAVLATLPLEQGDLALASVHLESHGDARGRAAQLEAVIDAVDRHAPGGPAVITGDMNTSSLDPSHADREKLRAALRADPGRFANPVPHEPLFDVLERRGFEWRACNDLRESTQRVKSPSSRGALRLDWIFCRGVTVHDTEVIAAVDPETGEALSDHEAVAATISLPGDARGRVARSEGP